MEARVRQYNVHMRYVAGLAGVKRYPPVPPSVAKERWTGACHRCGQAVTMSRAVFSTPGVWSCPSCAVTPLDGARDLLSRTRERAELCGLWAARAPSDKPRVGKGSAPVRIPKPRGVNSRVWEYVKSRAVSANARMKRDGVRPCFDSHEVAQIYAWFVASPECAVCGTPFAMGFGPKEDELSLDKADPLDRAYCGNTRLLCHGCNNAKRFEDTMRLYARLIEANRCPV